MTLIDQLTHAAAQLAERRPPPAQEGLRNASRLLSTWFQRDIPPEDVALILILLELARIKAELDGEPNEK